MLMKTYSDSISFYLQIKLENLTVTGAVFLAHHSKSLWVRSMEGRDEFS